MDDSAGIADGGSFKFIEPDHYQSAIHGGDNLYSLLGRGKFRAELTKIRLGHLTLQRGREYLPRLAASSMSSNKVAIVVWFGENQLPVVRGVQMQRGEMLCLGSSVSSHHRTFGPNDFAALSLDAGELARAAVAVSGRELILKGAKILRPPEHTLTWLLAVIDAATRVAMTTPDIFSMPQAADALEQALLRPLIMCLADGEERAGDIPHGRRASLANRFAAAVEANIDQPLLMHDFGRVLGVSERTLRTLCQEHFGIPPQRFLTLRRLHLARQMLIPSNQDPGSVTKVATSLGFWELGRFATTYKSLFGESPSTTLRRSPRLSEATTTS